MLQHDATRCNTLRHTASRGNTLDHTATQCNTHEAREGTAHASRIPSHIHVCIWPDACVAHTRDAGGRLHCSYSNVRDDAFVCVPRPISTCDTTHSCVWHDAFVWCVTRLVMCVTLLAHACNITHSNVWHDVFVCVTWLIYVLHAMQLGGQTALPLLISAWSTYTYTYTYTYIYTYMYMRLFLFACHDSFGGAMWLIHLSISLHMYIYVVTHTFVQCYAFIWIYVIFHSYVQCD